jgi:hypothetical protein
VNPRARGRDVAEATGTVMGWGEPARTREGLGPLAATHVARG